MATFNQRLGKIYININNYRSNANNLWRTRAQQERGVVNLFLRIYKNRKSSLTVNV